MCKQEAHNFPSTSAEQCCIIFGKYVADGQMRGALAYSSLGTLIYLSSRARRPDPRQHLLLANIYSGAQA
jgi:hypothetical protein